MIEMWLSTPAFTTRVEVDEKTWTIVRGGAVIKWAIGKPWRVLLNWCYRKWEDGVVVKNLNGWEKI